jgi:hypothetical protein
MCADGSMAIGQTRFYDQLLILLIKNKKSLIDLIHGKKIIPIVSMVDTIGLIHRSIANCAQLWTLIAD